MESQKIQPLEFFFSFSIIHLINPSCCIDKFFVLLRSVSWYGYTTSGFKHSPSEGHPGCFQFGPLQMKLLRTFRYTLGRIINTFLLSKHLGEEQLLWMVAIYLTCKLPMCFLKCLSFCSFFISSPTLDIVSCLTVAILRGVHGQPILVLICISLFWANWSFTYLLGGCAYSNLSPILKIGLFSYS